MQFTEIELKLIRLGLNASAAEGETGNSGSMLFKQLKKRGINADQFTNGSSSSSSSAYEGLYQMEQLRNQILMARIVSLEATNKSLEEKVRSSSPPPTSSSESGFYSQTRFHSKKAGIGFLSAKQREFLTRFGQAANNRSFNGIGGTVRSFCQNHGEFGTIQQLQRKGMIEKRGYCKHGLTEAGQTYYKQFCC